MATVDRAKTLSAWDTVRAMRGEHRARVLFRRHGKWVARSFSACAEEAAQLASELAAAGLRCGDVVALHGVTSYQWLVADLACVLLGARTLALYPNASLGRAIGAAQALRAKLVFADGRRWCSQYRRVGIPALSLRDEEREVLPRIGAVAGADEPPLASGPVEPFTLVSTSGTLSEPRFFAVSSHPLLFTMDRFREAFALTPRDSLLLALPLAHLPQRMLAYGALRHGITIVLSSPATFLQDTRERQPTIHVAVPRMLQFIDERIQRQIASPMVRPFAAALPVLRRVPRLAYRAIGARVFGRRARFIFVGSAATPRAVMTRLRALGCPIHEVYGTTELGIIAYTRPGAMRDGSIGQVVPWGQVDIEATSSEVRFRTDLPFLAGEISANGTIVPGDLAGRFVPTGDIGAVDGDGFVTLRCRTRDFVAPLSGEKIFVGPIEERLSAITGLIGALVVGDGQKHLGAVLFGNDALTTTSPGLRNEFLRREIAAINDALSPEERIRRFVVPVEVPSIENGCITETLKWRRHVINEKYASDYSGFTTV